MGAVATNTVERTLDQDRFDYLLHLGDNALVLGQRMGEWVGHAPALELEMAVSNLALDLIGEAQLWLDLAGRIEGEGRDADRLANFRDALDFRNLLIVEQPNGDWAFTVARHFLFSLQHLTMVDRLTASADEEIADIARKVRPEIAYHMKFARSWVERLGDGTEESHIRLQRAIDRLWRFTGEMFAPDAIEERLIEEAIAPDPRALEADWRAEVARVFEHAGGLTIPEVKRMTLGGREGHHSEHLGHLLCELQFLQRAYPGLEW